MVIVGLLLAVAALVVIASWWTDGYIGASEGILLFALYGGLVFGLFAASSVTLRILVMVPLLASACWGGYALKRGSLRQFYLDEIKRLRAAIDHDARNMAARRKLAEYLYNTGQIDIAIAEMQIIIEISPRTTEERYIVRQWEEEKRMRETGIGICPRCRTEYPAGVNWCRHCELPLTRNLTRNWLTDAGLKGFTVAFGSVSFIVLSFVLLHSIYALLPVGCLCLTLVGRKLMKR